MALSVLVAMTGCLHAAPPRATAAPPRAADVLNEHRRCEDPSDRPLVVEWSAADRAALEVQLRHGVVAVQREGCEVRVLPRCSVPQAYTYGELSPKREAVHIASADELYARLPVGAARLEGALEASGELVVEMAVVGRYHATPKEIVAAESALDHGCEGATHLVAGATVGAFELRTGAERALRASADVAGFGAGGRHADRHQTLRSDGDVEACAAGAPGSTCGALVQIELSAIGGVASPASGAAPADGPRARAAARQKRKARAWRATAVTSGVVAAASIGGVMAGSVMMFQADFDVPVWEDPSPAQVRRKNTGLAILVGSLVGGTGATALSIGAARTARRVERRSVVVTPIVSRQGGGIGISGRF